MIFAGIRRFINKTGLMCVLAVAWKPDESQTELSNNCENNSKDLKNVTSDGCPGHDCFRKAASGHGETGNVQTADVHSSESSEV